MISASRIHLILTLFLSTVLSHPVEKHEIRDTSVEIPGRTLHTSALFGPILVICLIAIDMVILIVGTLIFTRRHDESYLKLFTISHICPCFHKFDGNGGVEEEHVEHVEEIRDEDYHGGYNRMPNRTPNRPIPQIYPAGRNQGIQGIQRIQGQLTRSNSTRPNVPIPLRPLPSKSPRSIVPVSRVDRLFYSYL